jgi:DNA-directed RNA polymerase specialized sigma24 family protein
VSTAPETSALIQPLLDRLRAGDAAAVHDLTALTYDRLRRLAGKMLNESFPQVARDHSLNSVLNNAHIRLGNALSSMSAQAKTPPTPADYFRFAAFKIRQVLLDMAGADRRRAELFTSYEWEDGDSVYEPTAAGQGALVPELRARWREFLERVDALPKLERDVLQMHVLMELTQAQIAREMGLEPKQVSRAWLKAAKAVGRYLPT